MYITHYETDICTSFNKQFYESEGVGTQTVLGEFVSASPALTFVSPTCSKPPNDISKFETTPPQNNKISLTHKK